MAYRRTENVVRRLNARHDAIVEAARDAAAAGGMAAVQIVPVAERAGVAAGTVYRYFPGKIDLVGALVETVAEREIAAVRKAADAAPGPMSALVAAIATLGARALRNRRLAWAVIAEPVDTEVDALRQRHRKALAGEIEARIRAGIDGGHLPEQDAGLAASALVGALLEGPDRPARPRRHRRAGARPRRGAGAHAVRAARARRGRRARPRPRGAGGVAGGNVGWAKARSAVPTSLHRARNAWARCFRGFALRRLLQQEVRRLQRDTAAEQDLEISLAVAVHVA